MTFDSFILECAQTAYAEPESPLHKQLMPLALDRFLPRLTKGANILDIGCGNGTAMDKMKEAGMHPQGLTIIDSEVADLVARGHDVKLGDMNNVSAYWEPGFFNGVFARHSMEHTPCPYFVLKQIYSVMAQYGYLYIEVPLPDTPAHHERNPNHYSCLPLSVWAQLLGRCGFLGIDAGSMEMDIPKLGTDTYIWAIVQKV